MIFNRTRQFIAHADDVLIFEKSVRATEEFVTQLKEAALSTGLMTNGRKNKIHNINRNTTNIEQVMVIDGQAFKAVQHFRSVGILISSKNAVDDEIESRIVADNKYFYSLEQIFNSIYMSEAVDHYNHNHHHHH